jgi:hypothetical protein
MRDSSDIPVNIEDCHQRLNNKKALRRQKNTGALNYSTKNRVINYPRFSLMAA